ncbi:MAG: gamma-glutamyl-gamma-aminobutyrate hydrolase family protein [Sedimentisphaerales bacterium]|nr:gamma-glutamyl-gamma-aminobutyrate hydrolase family protein [Sedimentisphaerales bacterium]MBN2843173.1 gamma-glutamyl-gamma-aminobutyrate hydrolase family protein [Sedimentisphaerales bacterium]
MTINIALSMNYHFSADNIERAYLDHTYFDWLANDDVLCRALFPVEDDNKLRQYLATVSGLIFTGGLDLDPALWHEPKHPATTIVHQRRQNFELRLLTAAMEMQLPILGICLGMQLISVAHGGKLTQHIPDSHGQIDHGYNGNKTRHKVTLNQDSKLQTWLNTDSIEVPSAHHQGVINCGRLLPAAIADDGIIEAVELPGYPFLTAVQWHPEKEPELPLNRAIINEFIKSATLYSHP